jgi:putative ribosome biogenesis GTPase RsgA
MEKPLDLSKLKAMIKNGIASIPKDPNADQAVILIGDTGVGKSTVLAFLSGQ